MFSIPLLRDSMFFRDVVVAGIITIPATMIPTSVSATGIRHDPGDDATIEESRCWRDGYDSGFVGKSR